MAFRSSRNLPTTDAHAAALAMLSRRELSTSQVRQRLARKGFDASAIDAAIRRLHDSGALDDARVAAAAARTRALVKRQGRDRVAREIAALGIERDVARRAVSDVFDNLDERTLLEQALSRRLRGGVSLADPAARRRVFAALVRQGFSPDAISKAMQVQVHQVQQVQQVHQGAPDARNAPDEPDAPDPPVNRLRRP